MGSMSASPFFAALPSRALISVAGPDWRDFLHNLLTNDVAALKAGEVRFAALLTPQGRLLFDLFVIGREDGCWLDCQAERRAALIQRLSIYRLRAKVEIAIATGKKHYDKRHALREQQDRREAERAVFGRGRDD